MADNDKPKRQRPDEQVHTLPGDNTKYIDFNMILYKLDKTDMSNATEVAQRCEYYFALCAENDMKPNMASLAMALGLSRKCLYEYREGIIGKNPEVRDTLKKASYLLDAMMNEYMQNGKINPVSGIFLMKNNLGYTDKQEIVIKPQAPLGEQIAPDALADKYRDSIPAELDEN